MLKEIRRFVKQAMSQTRTNKDAYDGIQRKTLQFSDAQSRIGQHPFQHQSGKYQSANEQQSVVTERCAGNNFGINIPNDMMNHSRKETKISRCFRILIPKISNLYTGIWWYAQYPNHYAGDAKDANAAIGELSIEGRSQ